MLEVTELGRGKLHLGLFVLHTRTQLRLLECLLRNLSLEIRNGFHFHRNAACWRRRRRKKMSRRCCFWRRNQVATLTTPGVSGCSYAHSPVAAGNFKGSVWPPSARDSYSSSCFFFASVSSCFPFLLVRDTFAAASTSALAIPPARLAISTGEKKFLLF